MARSVYALLVGIDQYEYPVPPLRGCVNDVRAVAALLEARTATTLTWKPRLLEDARATRAEVVRGFEEHLCQAEEGDVALFYYSGHGSQEPAPPEYWPTEPDRLNETLVLFDSRRPGQWDLADKELDRLIQQAGSRGTHVLVVLDCCHSGSGTRDGEGPEGETRVRRAPTDTRIRPAGTYWRPPSRGPEGDPGTAPSKADPRRVVFMACRADQTAKELSQGGLQHGALTYALLEVLRRSPASTTYRELFKQVEARVRNRVLEQSPLLEASSPEDVHRPFLNGAGTTGQLCFTIRHDRERGWLLDGGRLHGLSAGGRAPLELAVYPEDAREELLQDRAESLGIAFIERAWAGDSEVRLHFLGAEPDRNVAYRAVPISRPTPSQTVFLAGDETATEEIAAALAKAERRSALPIARAESREEAHLQVLAGEASFRITGPDGVRLLTADVSRDAGAATEVVRRLVQIAAWTDLRDERNPDTTLPVNAVRMELYRVTGSSSTRSPGNEPLELLPEKGEARLEYQRVGSGWQQPFFKIRLVNHSGQRLFCTVLGLGCDYSVDVSLMPGGGEWLGAGEELWAFGGEPIPAAVPPELWEQGITEAQDVLKLVVATHDWDVAGLRREGLELPRVRGEAADAGETVARLIGEKARELRPDDPDWFTAEVVLTTVRRLDAVTLAPGSRALELRPGVRLLPHPVLTGRARLTTAGQAARAMGHSPLPSILLDDPEVARPYEFVASRGLEPGLDALELSDLRGAEAVSRSEPLILQIDAPSGRDARPAEVELLLPVTWDGEFFLPLGYGRRTAEGFEVELHRLPSPPGTTQERELEAGAERSVGGSLRILFQKLVSQTFGVAFEYPLLAVVTVDDAGRVTYHREPDYVRERVAAARSVLLYVHGIFGDTVAIAASARCPRFRGSNECPVPVGEHYDVLLTFDYENLQTGIAATADLLKQRLLDVGLGPGHGKTLHVVAHSMGGLVSRYLIERLPGGREMVDRLVMLGTPNGGSPWPVVEDFVTSALGLALNHLVGVPWPVSVVAQLVRGLEKVDRMLDEMSPRSELLQDLERAVDPNIPYVILAGNTSLLPAALEVAGGRASLVEKLLARLKSGRWLHDVTAPAFFGQPNDIAVLVESIRRVTESRDPVPQKQEVACDHLTYFETEAGLHALARALEIEPQE